MWIMCWSSLAGCSDIPGEQSLGRLLRSFLCRAGSTARNERGQKLIDSDDINKFLWMVRISQGEWPDEVQEANYFTQRGEYAVDSRA